MRNILLTSGIAGLVLLAGNGQAGEVMSTAKAVEYRQAAMTLLSSNLRAMSKVVNGKAPYDASGFARHAADLAAISGIDMLAGFPEDSEDEDSDALSEIWLDWEDFASKMQALQEESAKLRDAAVGGDLAGIKPQFGATADTCKACHDKYRE